MNISMPTYAPKGATVYLGMSGGVDSACSAALLKEWGYTVHAVYMRNWSRDLPGFTCRWADDLADAERVCVTLGLTLDVWDCEQEYKSTVVDYLIDAYARGYTPNPDVMCNQTIKFGTFAEKAFAHGADFIATGHYAQVDAGALAGATADVADANVASSADSGNADATYSVSPLIRAADEHKDQTYFLWRVPASRIAKTIFPIGDIPTKKQVRELCREFGLGVEKKPDSDGICFVGEVGIRTFLLDTLSQKAGDIVEWETGTVLGQHDGAFLYTIGQRRGLNLGGGPARYVVRTDTARNIVYVSSNIACEELHCTSLALERAHWLGAAPTPGARYCVRLRHTGALVPCTVRYAGEQPTLEFDEPIMRIAPGQSAVLYDGRRVCGGGFIAKHYA